MQFMIRIDGKLFNLRRLKAKTTHMTVLELQYADDIALVTHTEEDPQAAGTSSVMPTMR